MDVLVRPVRMGDLDAVTRVEAVCFPEAEAATRDSFSQRIETFPESFFVAELDGEIIGFINGCVTDSPVILDEMFEDAGYHKPDGAYQSIFGLDVAPQWQHKGIASRLMRHLIEDAEKKGRAGLILTCKERLIGFYEQFGYRNLGVSKSVHGGAVWYDMMLTLPDGGKTVKQEHGWKLRWRRLDNTAKIFPVIANEQVSQVFRISVTLKEDVDPELLQLALEEILPEIQNFRVKLRRGLFWYYFEENTRIPRVQRENTYPCRYIDPHGNQKFLFRVSYYERRINLEVFHALTDGLGASNFLKSLTRRYLQLKWGQEGGAVVNEAEWPERPRFQTRDSYLENYREMEHQSYSSRPAYRLEGPFLPLGTGQVLHGYVNVSSLKEVCRRHDVSITKYLAAALIWSIWQEYRDGKGGKLPIVLNLPINLRAFFGSETMANFFAVSLIGCRFQNSEMSFDKLVQIISRQMDKKIDRDKLEAGISYNVSNEKKWYLRAIPLVIKRPILQMVFRMKDRAYTTTLSNIGPIHMEPEYQGEIDRFHIMIGVSRSQPLKCAVCAWGDELVVTFTSVFADSRLQRRFFQKLKEDGVLARLEGNELCGARKRDMYPRIRRVIIRQKGGEEKAARMARKVGHTGGKAAKGIFEYASGRRSWKDELSRRFHV